MNVIDTHAHIMSTSAPLDAGRHSEPARDVTPEEFLGVLDAHGVACGVLTQPSFYGSDNSLMLSALHAHPTRLRGTAIVSTDIAPEALHVLYVQGVRGIRLNWFKRDTLPDYRGKEYRRLFGLARDQGLHVELYVEGDKLAAILPVIRSSGADVVVDHFGSPLPETGIHGPGFREMLKGVSAGDTWVKLSAPYRLYGAPPQPYVDALLGAAGGEQLLWGSDWPWVSHEEGRDYARCLADLISWVPEEAQRALILDNTPRRLFGFDRR